jgi:predicted ATP-grasp superfamily ATP-dependent carboligase
MMLGALLEELVELPGIEVLTSRDPRLPPLPVSGVIVPRPGEDAIALYRRGLASADAAWPTAPETGGTLERLARETLGSGKALLGCRPDSIRLTASKRATAELLRESGIPVAPTFAFADPLPALPGLWITKPDDGAGSEDTQLLPDWMAARERLAAEPERLIAQPWVDGEQLSLSLVCDHGVAHLLSCNRQRVGIEDGSLSVEGLLVNALADEGNFAILANRLAAAIPGLWGYVGVDLVLTRDGPVILEINPRLTTSYCGLGRALGINTAALVLSLLGRDTETEDWPLPTTGTAVEILLEASNST